MRASPRRSPVWLASPAALLVIVACTPQLDLSDRPPPCAPGYGLCATSGLCVPQAALSRSSIRVVQAVKDMNDVCPDGIDIRQGASELVPVPGASGADNDVTASASWDDHAATVKVTDAGAVAVDVSAAHGMFPGEVTPDGRPYTVTIAATIGGAKVIRTFRVVVSPIAVSTEGNDDAPGTALKPFKTMARAVQVSGLGDTIQLKMSRDGGAFWDKSTRALTLPAGVNVEGQMPLHPDDKVLPEDLRSKLDMPIAVAGDATIANVRLLHRLTITAPDTKVALSNVKVSSGITIEAGARAAHLRLANKSMVDTDDETVNPLLVRADDVGVAVESGSVVDHEGTNVNLETILFTGKTPTLQVWDDATIKTPIAPVAIRILESATVELDGHETPNGAQILGRVEILGAGSKMAVRRTKFGLAMLAGGILFKGSEMIVDDAEFSTEGIEQDRAGSLVTVRRSKFLTYTRAGYQLKAGRLDMGTMTEPGRNAFTKTNETWLGMTTPTALIIQAPAPTPDSASATVSMSTFDAEVPAACRVRGHDKAPGRYEVADAAILDFF